MKLGYTLAEVLITMTIIGVVAAMTLPSLGYKKNEQEYATKIKNFYSKMDNAIYELEMDHGEIKSMVKPNSAVSAYNWYMEFIDSLMGHQMVAPSEKTVYLKDGSSIAIGIENCIKLNYDVNGKKSPNTLGKDQFIFLICFDSANRKNYFGNDDSAFGTYGVGLVTFNKKRAHMIKACQDDKKFCSRLLENDGWNFKPDYPR